MSWKKLYSLSAVMMFTAIGVVLASGGVTSISLADVFKGNTVESIFVGEIRGYERRDVSGAKPSDETENVFDNYSYMEISFTVVPKKILRGDVAIGKIKDLCFREMTERYFTKLTPDGNLQEGGGPTAMGFVSTGSGGERGNQFRTIGMRAVFFVGTHKGDRDQKLLRVEPADENTLKSIEAFLTNE